MKARLLLLIILFAPVSIFADARDDKIHNLEEKVASLESRVSALEKIVSQRPPVAEIQIGDAWKSKANWRQLKLGMTKEQVKGILGEPPNIFASGVIGDYWYYPDGLGGDAKFDTSGLLESWKEP